MQRSKCHIDSIMESIMHSFYAIQVCSLQSSEKIEDEEDSMEIELEERYCVWGEQLFL